MSHSALCRIAISASRRARDPFTDRFPPGLSLRLPPRPAPPRAPVRKRSLYTPAQLQQYSQPSPPPIDIPVLSSRSAMDLDEDEDDDPFGALDWSEHMGSKTRAIGRDDVIICDEPEELIYQAPILPFQPKEEVQFVVVPPAPEPYDPEKTVLLDSEEDPTEGGTVIPIPPPSSTPGPNNPLNPTDEDLIEQIELLTGPLDASGSWDNGVRVFGDVLRFGGLGPRPEARVRYHRARYLAECGGQDDAVLEELVRSLDLDPRLYIAARALATLLRAQGIYGDAARLLNTCIVVAKRDDSLSWSERQRVLAELKADLSKQ